MKKFVIAFLASQVLLATSLFAQDDKIETDRPSETNTTALVSKGYFQTEIGVRKEAEKGGDYKWLHPRVQFKYGLSERFELRAELTGETERHVKENEFKNGLLPVEFGFKAKLLDEKGIVPATTLFSQVGIPNWASPDHQQPHPLPQVRMLFENSVRNQFKLAYNAGAEWQGDGSPPRWIYTFSPQLEIGKHWEAFVEEFAYLQVGQAAQHHLDAGLAYYATKNVKLDVWGGKGISEEAPEYILSAGLSFRFK